MWYNKANGDASIYSMATKRAKTDDDAKKENDSTLAKFLKKFNDSWTYAQ